MADDPSSKQPSDPLLGLFADEPELMDEIVEEAMKDRETKSLRASERDKDISLEEVRKATASIPGSMAEAIIEEERAERF